MIYFCADDYGISNVSNSRIEKCVEKGVLNKISVLPNGELGEIRHNMFGERVKMSLHLNLVEGHSLSNMKDVNMLVDENGCFKYSFIGLLLLSIFGNRKNFKKQLYNEIKSQIDYWKNLMGDDVVLFMDSHQHTHMIPLVFKTLLEVIQDENLQVENIRIPSEPIIPYLSTPSLYLTYSISGLLKHWLLNFLALFNIPKLKKSKIEYSIFMGAMFSGHLNEYNIKKIIPKYLKIAKKRNKNIEIAFHPGYVQENEKLMNGYRNDFKHFYFSEMRKTEFNTLINSSLNDLTKEG